jgi:uncharacterized protein YjbI with pentapeptide repeats
LAVLDGDPAPHGDVEAALILDRDLGALDATGAAFQATRIERCRLDDATLADTRLTECLLVEVGATGLDIGGSTWRDVILEAPRIGALAAIRAHWSSVRVRGGRIDFLVLAGARLDDVAFEDCSIGELDLGDARLRNVTFDGCELGVLDVASAHLVDVDLSGAKLTTIRGAGSLRGATVSTSQLIEMGPLLADLLGIRVRDAGTGDD